MRLLNTFSFFTLFATAIFALVVVDNTSYTAHAFVKGSAARQAVRPASSIELNAVAKKKTAKKKTAATTTAAAAKKKAAPVVKKPPMETLRKPELIASVAEKMDCTKAEATMAVAAVLDTITEEVVNGKKVSLPGFGIFSLRERSARKGRNPQTGEVIDIAASKSPGFTAAKAFKELANE